MRRPGEPATRNSCGAIVPARLASAVESRPTSPAAGGGQARLVAAGAITQQAAQATGLLVLLAIVTALARRLSLPELGTYGLMSTLAVYLLILKNSISNSALRAMVAARDDAERVAAFSTCVALYAVAGVATGALILAVGFGASELVLDGGLQGQAHRGAALLGAITAVGLAISVNLDAMRGALLLTRSAANEILALVLFAGLMLGLITSDAPLWVLIGASGSIPFLSGIINFVAKRALGLPFRFERGSVSREQARRLLPTAGYVLILEGSNVVIYGLNRIVLGVFASATTLGLYEGPARAHNVLYALNQAMGLTSLSMAASYVGESNNRRLRELVVRGSRYTLALTVPLAVTLMVLAGPTLELWLGERYRDGAGALAIMTSYWLLYGQLALTPNFLVGAGKAREIALLLSGVAVANLALSLALTPVLGLEGPALGTAVPFVLAAPFVLRLTLAVSGATVSELLRQAWLPAYGLGAVLAVVLAVVNAFVALDSLVVLTAVLIGGPLAYWLAYAAIFLSRDERALVAGLLKGYRGS